jgi:hypothetical protein
MNAVMTSLPAAGGSPAEVLIRLLRQAQHRSPLLWRTGLVLFAVSLPVLALGSFDERLINGVSIWLKPWKFMVSSAIYLMSLSLALATLPLAAARSKAGRYVAWVATASALFEVAYITWRASRGEASHFNIATPGAALMYAAMGIGAVLLASTSVVAGAMVIRAREFAFGRALHAGVGWGLVLGGVLSAVTGGYMSSRTGHWVGGVPSDAGGLAVFQWARDAGDLRVAHFFGLHAMQFLPAFALAARSVWADQPARRATLLFAALYTGLTAFTFLQALAGRSFF